MLSEKQAEMLNHMFNPKFFATMDKQGNPNLVVITCAEFYGGDIIFGNLFLWKTARNLKENPQVAMLVMDQKLNYFLVEGVFDRFEESGPLLDRLNRSDMVRYNAYTGLRNAGVIKIKSVAPLKKYPLAKVFGGFMKASLLFRGKPNFPANVGQTFSQLMSLKAVAYNAGGRLQVEILPGVGVNGDYLVPALKLPEGVRYAANVITTDVVSFQVKGVIERRGLRVEEVYAAGPPVVGKRIYRIADSKVAG
ncbi:MAG TPA: pyridoxamine 5'-phosphate oxidase family protein [Bacillota bacterium]|jgi:hypothetical protein|nr:pyridoxamine 5'-phosphate oxidase family protein [Bacillota bacterium]HOB87777.1 pyridoxamine 5'-phosphate oxidase family protein [Bacillota bacterium]HOP69051.1 pyridoxamine 5'-phosphate oxidase family protein [Bacillota bacterium]HPT33683.1 pyridoxamine 5'-phosphate oxidase family protein [Bacillota bacterium]HQD06496.1 pyridoxamine 5'-phosphate oxidase family protein [Bacillota bacterium]